MTDDILDVFTQDEESSTLIFSSHISNEMTEDELKNVEAMMNEILSRNFGSSETQI